MTAVDEPLSEICQQLHMSGNGSSDLMFADEREAMVAYLLKRIADWKLSDPASDAYDNAVKALLRATIAEEPYAQRCSR
jgi:hypothetical protein